MISQYDKLCATPSDINEHLPILKAYAEQCDHVTEFGVRSVVSIWAYIAAGTKKIVGYDIKKHANMDFAVRFAFAQKQRLSFVIKSTLDAEIEETDMLFIDTIHNYKQVYGELFLHASKVKKYIGFHDVVSFGYKNEIEEKQIEGAMNPRPGIMPAILEFILDNPEWRIDYFTTDNNGLLIIKRAA